MSKPKFKVGDKVRILDGSKIENYCGGWAGSMKDYIGKTATIKSVESYINYPTGYRLEEYGFKWDERGLELKPEKIIIYRNDNQVIAKNILTGKTGVAKCNPADEFDFNIGAKLAFERLTNPEPEKPKYYSGKVVCTNSVTSAFTKGKIYKVNNGVLDSDAGCFQYHRFKSFDDILVVLATEFIELIEN